MLNHVISVFLISVSIMYGAETVTLESIKFDENGKFIIESYQKLNALSKTELIDLIHELKVHNDKLAKENDEIRAMCKYVRDVAKGLNDKLAQVEDELKKVKKGEF